MSDPNDTMQDVRGIIEGVLLDVMGEAAALIERDEAPRACALLRDCVARTVRAMNAAAQLGADRDREQLRQENEQLRAALRASGERLAMLERKLAQG